jgi:dihydroxyacetone kinase DhaKLM complex PTS-EIIA-like component DhaM
MARPLVSVLMAARNAAGSVARAVSSVLRQSQDDLELLVVDDGSADATADVVLELARSDRRIRLLRRPVGRGQAAALNVAVAEARGRLVATLDADDEAEPDRLALQASALERDRGLVLLGGAAQTWCDRYDRPGTTWRYALDDGSIRARTLFKSEHICGAMTLDRERLPAADLRFDEGLRVGADWSLSIAAMRAGRVANLPDVVLRYRFHAGQLTHRMSDDLGSDSTRIRAGLLARAGIVPTDEEMRIHLAVSPCAYWPFGSHPLFRARRSTIRRDAAAWLERIVPACAGAGLAPEGALRGYAGEILAAVDAAIDQDDDLAARAHACCPVAAPSACLVPSPCR